MAGPDEARDERAVTERVHAGRATDEALRTDDPAREVWMACIDAGVDDRDWNRLERGQRDPRGVEAAVREVPLLRHERIARREREMTRENRLNVTHAGDPLERHACGHVDDQRRDRL